jgi:hypothetical protein
MAKSQSGLDQSKRGLQDDHDPSDLGQRVANKPGGIRPTGGTRQKPETPPDADSMGQDERV